MLKTYSDFDLNNYIYDAIKNDDFDLGARKSVKIVGDLVLKKYQRGGMLTKLDTDLQFKSSTSRAKHEYEILSKLSQQSVSVPQVMGYLEDKGILFEKSYLITKKIEGKTFKELKDEVSEDNLKDLALEIKKLIDLNIHHIDLNPENVMLGSKIVILDFDKAVKKTDGLKSLYISRWNRAVVKHNLPSKFNLDLYLK